METHSELLLSRGPLILDMPARCLSGPAGSTILAPAEVAVMAELMRGGTVGGVASARDSFMLAAPKTQNPRHAVAMRVMRLRRALKQVGVPGRSVRCFREIGYYLMFAAHEQARVYSAPQVIRLDRLLASHPNRQAVARLLTG